RGVAGVTHQRDELALRDLVAAAYESLREMPVVARPAIAVVDDDELAVALAVPAREHDHAGFRGVDRRVGLVGGEVQRRVPGYEVLRPAVRVGPHRVNVRARAAGAAVELAARAGVDGPLRVGATALRASLDRRTPRDVSAAAARYDDPQARRRAVRAPLIGQVVVGRVQDIAGGDAIQRGDLLDGLLAIREVVDAVLRQDVQLRADVDQVNVVLQRLGVGPEDRVRVNAELLGNREDRIAGLH